MNLFHALSYRSFALLWSGQALARCGDSLYRVALAWWVLEKTGSATAMSLVFIFSSIPMLLFLLVGGVAVDRFARPRVMFACDAARGILATAVALLAYLDQLQLGHIYLASAAFGLISAFFRPAYIAVLPELTADDALKSANSLTVLSAHIASILGSALGAVLVSAGATALAFGLNGLAFFIAATTEAVLWSLPHARRARVKREGIIRNLQGGLRAVLQSPLLWITITITALANVSQEGPFGVALPFLVKKQLNADVGALGLLYAMISVGAVIAALWFGRTTQMRRRGVTMYGALLASGGVMLTLGLPIGLGGVVLAALVFGISTEVFYLIWTNTLQAEVAPQLLGRIVSVDELAVSSLQLVGFGVAGWATDLIGASNFFLIAGAFAIGLTAFGLLHPAIRRLN
jgi:DHA3 family tetracycline resistance protein-like MFS transporter